jgi:hypothetical protein
MKIKQLSPEKPMSQGKDHKGNSKNIERNENKTNIPNFRAYRKK